MSFFYTFDKLTCLLVWCLIIYSLQLLNLTSYLQDFYLDLVEDNRRITPRDYLELALRPVEEI